MNLTFAELSQQVKSQAPDIPDNWKQGRTAFGGLSAALLLTHARLTSPDLPPLRSALINFTGPVTGPPGLSSNILRQGRNVTTIESRADTDGQTVCTATFSFGAARESHLHVDLPAPDAPPPNQCDLFADPKSTFVPTFTRNFDTHLIEGTRPMTGGTRGYLRCWARHKDEASREGDAALLCLADILPPATMPIMQQFGPVSSMTWICNFLRPPKTDDGWYQVEADLTVVMDGYSSQVMRIWNSKGKLVVEGMQSIAIFV